jgi:Domain of unknown function (DUF4405)
MTARKRLPIDMFMFAAFLVGYKPFSTGLSLHEWLCVVLVAPVLVHMVINWDWTVRVSTSFFSRLRRTTRVNLIVDIVLFVFTVAVMLSGFMVSRVFAAAVGFSTTPAPIWYRVHSLSADIVIGSALVHFALHWKWFVRAFGWKTARRAGRHPRHADSRDLRNAEPVTVMADTRRRPSGVTIYDVTRSDDVYRRPKRSLQARAGDRSQQARAHDRQNRRSR